MRTVMESARVLTKEPENYEARAGGDVGGEPLPQRPHRLRRRAGTG
ncbi:MAG: hypothetical protein ACLSAF_07805 [Intestinimonas sp.]